jgi:hypothetical protein
MDLTFKQIGPGLGGILWIPLGKDHRSLHGLGMVEAIAP